MVPLARRSLWKVPVAKPTTPAQAIRGRAVTHHRVNRPLWWFFVGDGLSGGSPGPQLSKRCRTQGFCCFPERNCAAEEGNWRPSECCRCALKRSQPFLEHHLEPQTWRGQILPQRTRSLSSVFNCAESTLKRATERERERDVSDV